MDDYNYMNQHMWWRNETSIQNPYTVDSYNYESYTNDSYDYECYDNHSYDEPYENDGYYDSDPYVESYDNDIWCTDNSTQYQYDEPPYFLDDPGSSEQCSFNEKMDQFLDMMDNDSKSLANIQRYLDQIAEHLNQQPTSNLSDTTQTNEVTFLCSDELHDNEVHKPLPPEVEVVVEDCVSLDDEDTERISEFKEVVIESEKYQKALHEPITPKVGEGSVEANTTTHPTTLRKLDTQPLAIMYSESSHCYKQPNAIIDRPFLSTIYTQVNCREGAINVTFGNRDLRILLFRPTDDPPIRGDHFMIDIIDAYVYEHTAYMLSDTARNLENSFSCNRSKELNYRSQNMKKTFWKKKHNANHAHKSRLKVFKGTKPRLKNFTRRKDACFFKTRLKRFCGNLKRKRLGLHKVKDGVPFDPGKNQENDSLLHLPSSTQEKEKFNMVDFQESQLTYDPP